MIEPADAIAGMMRANATVAAAFTTSGLVAIYSNERPERHGGTTWTDQSTVTPTAVVTVQDGQILERTENLVFDGQIEIAIYASTRDTMKSLAATIHAQLNQARNQTITAAGAIVKYFYLDEPTDFDQFEINTGIKYAVATYNATITEN